MRIHLVSAVLVLCVAQRAAVAQCTQPCVAAFAGNQFDPRVSMGGPNLLLAIRQQAAAAVTVQAIEVFTGKVSGENSVAIWSHDTVNNRPLAELAVGRWRMTPATGWQGANLGAPVALLAGTTFWVVWGPQNSAQASVEGNGPGAQPYRSSFDGGQTWNGPWQDHQWKLRLYCCRIPTRVYGEYALFGTGCGGSGRDQPALGNAGVPVTGQSFLVNLTNATPNRPAILGVGLSATQWLGVPLPLGLAPLGAPGCTLLASFEAVLVSATDPVGVASLSIAVPNVAGLVGADFYDQWVVFDPQNNLGLTFSSAGKGTVGDS